MKKIIVVEDELITSMFVEKALEKNGFDVVAVTAEGEKVISLILQNQPDLILLDVKLKGQLNGIEVAKAIRDAKMELPIIFTTGNSDKSTLEELKKIGINDFLFKPFNQEEMIYKINSILNNTGSK